MAPSFPALTAADVHIWRIALERDTAALEPLLETLSADERARAERFYFPKHRAHFIAGRGLMRTILGRYLACKPAELRFIYQAQGKPALPGGELRFNLAHSHGLALLAVSRGREVGVDLERIRAEVSGPDIAERFFSEHERAALAALPVEQRVEAFFRCWTRKEAYIKAIGKGLALPLDSFDVSLAPDEPAALLAVRGVAGEVERWTMGDVPLPAGYVGALAVEGVDWRLRCGDWM